jgi:hypothetical protein
MMTQKIIVTITKMIFITKISLVSRIHFTGSKFQDEIFWTLLSPKVSPNRIKLTGVLKIE